MLKPGKEIKLHIGYINEYGRYEISQIEIDDTIYLNMSVAEQFEYSNYIGSVITSYVFMGIGGVLLLLSIVYYIRLRKIKNNLLEYDKSNKENIYNYK